MIPANLKVGDTFKDGNGSYEVTKVIPGGYESKLVKYEYKPEYINEIPTPKKTEVVEEKAPAEQLDSFNKYTKTEINRLNNAELEKVCDKLGLEKSTGMAMKKAIIEKLGL